MYHYKDHFVQHVNFRGHFYQMLYHKDYLVKFVKLKILMKIIIIYISNFTIQMFLYCETESS